MIVQPIQKPIEEDLSSHKMVFVAGPRQVGKTRLSWSLLPGVETNTLPEEHPGYLNWDNASDRHSILEGKLPSGCNRLVFDELHKYPDWRRLLKGIFDKQGRRIQIMVTGSARLDYYRHGGDSLQGRYFFYRLHPISPINIPGFPDAIERLLLWGGYPEPFLEANQRFYNRWQNLRRKRLIEEDLLTLEKVREVSKVDMLTTMLPSRVGSILSINSLREDLGVGFDTASHWIEILENLYYCFRIAPYTHDRIKGMKKEKKLFLWDWSLVQDAGARLENFVASMLLKYCHWQEDVNGEVLELKFVRDKEKREIDFLVTSGDQIKFAVECKSQSTTLSKHFTYFHQRLDCPAFFQVHRSDVDVELTDLPARILPLETFVRDVLKL